MMLIELALLAGLAATPPPVYEDLMSYSVPAEPPGDSERRHRWCSGCDWTPNLAACTRCCDDCALTWCIPWCEEEPLWCHAECVYPTGWECMAEHCWDQIVEVTTCPADGGA